MELIRVVLCSECEHCPAVVITEHDVTIGEHENIVRLSYTEWNELVRRIASGELAQV
jgi:hypothetical protein